MATKITDNRYKTSVYLGKDHNGKRIQKVFYARTADEADFLALEFKLKKRQESNPTNLTLGKAIDQYIDSKDAILSPNTIVGYKQIRRNRLQSIMDKKLCEVDSAVLQKALNDEYKLGGKHGKGLEAGSIKNASKLAKATINFFYPDKRIKVTLPKEQKKEYATPNGTELIKIFQAAENTKIEIPILLASWLSLRIGEVCGLKWKDIKNGYIEINESMSYIDGKAIPTPTKTASSNRKIPLPIYIKNKLDRIPKEGEYIVNLKSYQIRRRFKSLLEKNGLRACRFHDLRHANASIMLQLGIPDKYAQERGGWASTAVLKSVYQQTFTEEQLNVAKKIDDYFESLIHISIHTKEK